MTIGYLHLEWESWNFFPLVGQEFEEFDNHEANQMHQEEENEIVYVKPFNFLNYIEGNNRNWRKTFLKRGNKVDWKEIHVERKQLK